MNDHPEGFHRSGRETAPCRLLIVDDDESVRAVVARVTAAFGFEVRTAVNGRRAAQMLATKPCDVLVTDIHMPETDGLELIRHARSRWPSVVIIAMSGGGNFGFDYLKTARLLGATHVLAKPFEVGQLAEIFRGLSGVAAWGPAQAVAGPSP